MRAVILASGRSQRLEPFRDKVLVEFLGETLLSYQINQLKNAGITDLVVIYGAHNEMAIREQVAKFAQTIELVEQEELELGMAGALLSLAKARPDAEAWLVVSSNDVISEAGLARFLNNIATAPQSGRILAKTVDSYFPGGYLSLAANQQVVSIIEKPKPGTEPSDLVNLVYHYHPDSSQLVAELKAVVASKQANNQDLYEQALDQLFKSERNAYFAEAYDGYWYTIKYPWHIYDMAKGIFQAKDSYISPDSEISPAATIIGPVIIEKGVRIEANAYIKGPVYLGENTLVGVGAFIRESFIGADCIIGYNTEIARSYLSRRVRTHLNYVGDSIIGENVSFGAGTVTGNLRLDEEPVLVNIKGEKLDSGRNKLGIITGDNIRIGIGVSLMPGVEIGSNTMIAGHLAINEDIPDNSFVKSNGTIPTIEIRPNQKQIPQI
jgi:NDP-sugar pyrophosphorylase family protein